MTPAEQIRKIARDVGEQAQFHYTWDSTVAGYLKVTAGKLQALADHLEGEPTGGLREAARHLVDLHVQEQEGLQLPTPDEWMDAVDALAEQLGPHPGPAATPKPPESAVPRSEGEHCPECGYQFGHEFGCLRSIKVRPAEGKDTIRPMYDRADLKAKDLP